LPPAGEAAPQAKLLTAGVALNPPNSIPLWGPALEAPPTELSPAEVKPAVVTPAEPKPTEQKPAELPDTPTLYANYATLVWRALVHLGVPEADREDLLQEVFVIVHRSRDGYEGRGQLTSWLYGIALRVASRHRRRETVRKGSGRDSDIHPVELHTPEHALVLRQRAELLERILARLPAAKREVFVMFEIQGLSTEQVARAVGVARGTIFSRLHAAREEFLAVWQELEGASPTGASR
jgi:RNA polymerase sigma-70 factor, ECF subfamily